MTPKKDDKTTGQRFRFRRNQHVRLRKDFQSIFARKCSVGDSNLVVYVDENTLNHPRMGISISKRIGIAVIRNRQKRRLREAFRLSQHQLPDIDLVCVIRHAAATVQDYQSSLGKLTAAGEKKLHRR